MARRLVTEYSRTPEVRYPVALEECYELLDWAVSRADELGLDAGRVAVAGDCAGATPAAAVTMLAKSRGGPRLSAQLLYYPLTDSRCDSPSQWQFATGHLLTRRALRTYWGRYVTDPALRWGGAAAPPGGGARAPGGGGAGLAGHRWAAPAFVAAIKTLGVRRM
ncbi:alpha/beta hydrolase fold domain-containing protein [Streptomyces tubercidicus]